MKKYEDLKNLLLSLEKDADKFYNKGNSVAGTRLRKGMLELKKYAQAVRLDILEKRGK